MTGSTIAALFHADDDAGWARSVDDVAQGVQRTEIFRPARCVGILRVVVDEADDANARLRVRVNVLGDIRQQRTVSDQ